MFPLNVPNVLTLVRILLVPVLVVALLDETPNGDLFAAIVFAVALALTLFSSLGVVVGIYAESWDHAGFVNNIVILPLTFLGGVFYSVDLLPEPWREVSHANPIFYIVQSVRYGFLGTSDVSVALALGVTAAMAAVMVAWSSWLFRTGHKLKP